MKAINFRTLKDKIRIMIAAMSLFAVVILLTCSFMRRPAEREAGINQDLQGIGDDLTRLDAYRNAFLFHFQHETITLDARSEEAEASAREILTGTGNEIDNLAGMNIIRRDTVLSQLQAAYAENFSGLSASVNALFRAVRERGNAQTGLIAQWMGLMDQMKEGAMMQGSITDSPLEALIRLEAEYLRTLSTRNLEEIATLAGEMPNSIDQQDSGIPMDVLNDYLSLTQRLIIMNATVTDGNGSLLRQTEMSLQQVKDDGNRLSSALRDKFRRRSMASGMAGYGFIALVFATGAFWLIRLSARHIDEPLKRMAGYASQLSHGILPEEGLQIRSGNGMGEVSQSLELLAGGLRDKYLLTKALNENNFEFPPRITGEEDLLGKELVSVRKKLIETTEEQARNNEENMRRRYINEGLAKFAGILRTNNDNLSELGDVFIRNMVNYLKAIQGGLFLLQMSESDEKTLDLIAAFAYDRKKYLEKRIAVGEGLIGTCAIEKTTINLTEIPEGYISITSGLGDTPPGNLLLVPVMHEKELIGVIEVASMKKFQDFEIRFADEVAQSLAATIIYTRNNERTNELLRKSQQQAVEMAEQEEEMRQNMEELKATQEESARREEEYRGMVKAIESSILVVEYDTQGMVTRANDRLCAFLGKSMKEVIGKTHQQVFGSPFDPAGDFWEELRRESYLLREETLETGGKKETLKEHFASVMTEGGALKKYMNFIFRA